jgi:peptidoglycan/xylan/chitin deacetylase (PgdA/CDA1 family)
MVVEQAGDDTIVQHYEQLGGSGSFLGTPVGSAYDIAGGRAQDYTGGTIYWSPGTGAHEVHGAIRGHYLALGGPAGFLGFPLTDETTTPSAPGRYNNFARGTIYWSPATGAHEVHGAIHGHYLALGGPAGFLGFPLTDETTTPGAPGRYNNFAGGTIYWSPASGAHEVHGSIQGRYLELGGSSGVLGFPLTDEYGITGGRRNDFQHGSILWHAASGRTEVIYTSIPAALLGVDLERIPTTQKVVALTFDAGANDAGLRSILATLAANGVPGTFFLTGNWVNQFPSDPALIYNSGNRIGNHSMTHPDFTTLTDAQIMAEISSAQRTIEAAGGDPLPFFRFPFGARDSRTIADANAAGYVPIRWTVDTLGWQGTMNGTRGPGFIVQRVMASAQPGEIVLMHLGSNPDDGSTLDAAALPEVISQLRAAGYGFVTLDAALG